MSDQAMICFLPANAPWVQQPLPHMTLVFCGNINDLQPTDFNTLGKDAISVGQMMSAFTLQVVQLDQFDEGIDAVDVLTLYPSPSLLVARRFVEKWNKSEHPFTPHVTIGPAGSAKGELPTSVFFDRVAVAWGGKLLTFQLMF